MSWYCRRDFMMTHSRIDVVTTPKIKIGMHIPRMLHVVVRLLLVLALRVAGASTLREEDRFSEVEDVFISAPNSESARQNLRFITSKPHVAGTDGDQIMADYVSEQFRSAGIPDVSLFHLEAMLNYPQNPPRLELLDEVTGQPTFRAKLSEDILDFDDTSDTWWRNHTFHGYGASGRVEAPIVFANYGRPLDFDLLKKSGVDVKGKLALVRYGKCFRGLKVRNAQNRGAIGVIIYSDPLDDGFSQGAAYPDGPWRSESSVQRGSVQFLSQCAGDPMRSDARYGSTTVEDLCGVQDYTQLIPSIPSLPISYGDALPLLKAVGGPLACDVYDDFEGGLNIEYKVGPSDSIIRLVVDNFEEIRKIPNVVGVIPGALPKEEDMPVLLGNHRDAWVYGAADPNSGTAALLEVARGLGKLLETGWKPQRSIYLLSWSGEEYGLLGSTGWAELNTDLIARAVAYLNVDTIVSGEILRVSATPSLATLWQKVLSDLKSADQHYMHFGNEPLGQVLDANTNWILNDPEMGILGSGSDYTVFLDHLGIASLDFRFEKHAMYGQYHSIYDSFTWMDAYGGVGGVPGSAFDLIAFGAKIWGLLALRLADYSVIPVDQIVQGEALVLYSQYIENQEVGLDLSNLERAVKDYRRAAATLQLACSNNATADSTHCNTRLGLVERKFLSPMGLPGRPWFKHVLQAPGVSLGYAAEAFPGVQQAIDIGDLDSAQEQVEVAAEIVFGASIYLGGN